MILIIISQPHSVVMHNNILNLNTLHTRIYQQLFNDLINSGIYFSCTMVPLFVFLFYRSIIIIFKQLIIHHQIIFQGHIYDWSAISISTKIIGFSKLSRSKLILYNKE